MADHREDRGSEAGATDTGAGAAVPPPDADLLTRVRAGDDAAFGELYRRHARSVRQHARGNGLDSHTAEDVTEEAFVRTLEALRHGGGPRSSARGYLLVTVRRMAAGWFAGNREERAVSDLAGAAASARETAHHSAETRALVRADRSLLTTAFLSLPVRWREVLWRTAVEGQPLSRVGDELGLSPNATAVLAHRAREGLRQAYLQAHIGELPSEDEDCRRYAHKLGAFIRRTSTSRGLRRHLDSCDRCRAAYLELVDVNATLRGLAPFAAAGWFATAAPTTTAAPPLGGAAGTAGLAALEGATGGALGKFAIAATLALAAGPAVPAGGAAVLGPDAGAAAVAAAPEDRVDRSVADPAEPADNGPAGPSGQPGGGPPEDTGPDPDEESAASCPPVGESLTGILLGDLGCPAGVPLLPGLPLLVIDPPGGTESEGLVRLIPPHSEGPDSWPEPTTPALELDDPDVNDPDLNDPDVNDATPEPDDSEPGIPGLLEADDDTAEDPATTTDEPLISVAP
ncbi:RNA polymerase sigma factor [Streptomyces litchfieldiae]|uniref:Sigma-70 family RNA polymerase sigma factor n=1 Tax=Streptomyces litchfieldiae TaxID=3075543 RepID=A0ABU2MJ90_9ACTN|nr:sigma-70 family RNA polymerase sigma factor [Streptomyces sp. DSM 44938]MDT0341502.1 sigma-70 family RNA polymerase sigma factor [Streptomyces sp. DSM 44938]